MRTALPALLALSLSSLPVARAEGPKPVATFQPDAGFIDDPFDFSPDGGHVAYLTTDGATTASLHFAAVSGSEPPVTLPYPSITPERIDFLDEERILVVDRNPETSFARAQVYTRKGASPKEKLGPASDIVLATVGGTPAIVTYLRTERGKGVVHTLTAVRRSDWKPLGKRVLTEDAEGRVKIAGANVKLLFFEDNYTALVGQKEGVYDEKHDIRRPDLATRIDVFAGKQLAEHEIKDLIAWAELANLRKKHQNESAFVHVTDDLDKLQLVDHDDVVSDLATPRPFRKYDPKTLAFQPAGADLVVSLTVDPVNPDAVAAKKADKDWIDLFRLDPKERALKPLVALDGEKRPSAWRVSGHRLGLLRKHKGFARGGVELDVFDVAQ